MYWGSSAIEYADIISPALAFYVGFRLTIDKKRVRIQVYETDS